MFSLNFEEFNIVERFEVQSRRVRGRFDEDEEVEDDEEGSDGPDRSE